MPFDRQVEACYKTIELINKYFLLDPCTATNPSEGTVSETAPAHGATITYSCTTTGYSLSGTATRTCTAGTLSGTAPTCQGGILANNYTVGKKVYIAL